MNSSLSHDQYQQLQLGMRYLHDWNTARPHITEMILSKGQLTELKNLMCRNNQKEKFLYTLNFIQKLNRVCQKPRSVIAFSFRELSFFTSPGGGCGRNGMKDSVKFLIPLGSSRKIVDPLCLWKFYVTPPPPLQTTTTKSLLGLQWCRADMQRSLPLPAGGLGAL